MRYATARADELTTEELIEGGNVLTEKLRNFSLFLRDPGRGAFRQAFRHPRAMPGLHPEKLGGICSAWVLPNPSGLNANYQMDDLVRMLKELKAAVDEECRHER